MNDQTNPPSYPQPIFFNPKTASFSPVPEQEADNHSQPHHHKPFPAELLKRLLANGSSNNLLTNLLAQSLQSGQTAPSPDFAMQALSSLLANTKRPQNKKEDSQPSQNEKEEIIEEK